LRFNPPKRLLARQQKATPGQQLLPELVAFRQQSGRVSAARDPDGQLSSELRLSLGRQYLPMKLEEPAATGFGFVKYITHFFIQNI
jgi:hypothetical protein